MREIAICWETECAPLIGGKSRDPSRTRSQIEREQWTCGPDALSMPLVEQTVWLGWA